MKRSALFTDNNNEDLVNINYKFFNFHLQALVVMSKSTLRHVALELDFPEKIVRRALRKYRFECAGDFVDYLESCGDEFEMETEDEKEEVNPVEKNISIVPSPSEANNQVGKTELTVREEAKILFRQSRCLMCWKEKRAFVCLPCCHFSLCKKCESFAKYCPFPSCTEKITATIRTFGPCA